MFPQRNEIVTFALGNYSSHVVTHFFNVQEASFSYNPNFKTGINHDALFRESLQQSKTSYTPRLIIADDEEALGYVSRDGYFKISDNFIAGNHPEKEVKEKTNSWEKNEFINDYVREKERTEKEHSLNNDLILKNSYNLDDNIVSWSDYLIAEFNHKTIVTLPKNTEYYENYDRFSNFQSGISLWNKTPLHEEIEENTRFYMEEVDNFQGFQVLFDAQSGYSGIGSGCLEHLHDEYNKKAILAIPVLYTDLSKNHDVQTQHRKRFEKIYSLSSGLSLASQYCDIVVPMSHLFNPWGKNPKIRTFKNIKYNNNLMYHTSAILAAALDLFTLPCRMLTETTSLNSMASTMSIYGRNIAAVGLTLPLSIQQGEDSFSATESTSSNLFDCLTPHIEINPENIDIQTVAAKGLRKAQINLNSKSADEFLKAYIQRLFPRVISSITSCNSGFRIPRTFPSVLNQKFNLSLADNCYGPLGEFVALGGIHNTRKIGNVLNNLYDEVKAVNIKRIPGFGPRDSEIDYAELFEEIKILGLKYLDITYI